MAVKKYQYAKNRDYYLKRLNEVYAPLYSIIIKQETFRQIYSTINPAIQIPSILFTESIKGDIYISFKDFEKVITSINKGLARPKLLIIINQYKQLIDLREFYAQNLSDYTTQNEKTVKNEIISNTKYIEQELKLEIIDGYKECVKKLNLESSFETIIDNCILKEKKNS
jgi:hypothetical protein